MGSTTAKALCFTGPLISQIAQRTVVENYITSWVLGQLVKHEILTHIFRQFLPELLEGKCEI